MFALEKIQVGKKGKTGSCYQMQVANLIWGDIRCGQNTDTVVILSASPKLPLKQHSKSKMLIFLNQLFLAHQTALFSIH